jgi:geranylgeranyl pyrophosphate synthase
VTTRPEQLARVLAHVETRIAEVIHDSDPLVLRYVDEFAHQPGKRLRPRLLAVMAELFGGADEAAVANCAACCELLHTATLIHDDVIDEAPTRRRMATVNSRFGNEIAVVVGDYVLAALLRALSREQNFPLLDLLLDAGQQMGLGVIQEVINRSNLELDEASYLEIARLKTGVLFGLSCQMGAMLAEADSAAVQVSQEYGVNLGLAFQIADDLLDLTRSDEQAGKPVMNDLREGRITLPLIYALEHNRNAVTAAVHRYEHQPGEAANTGLRDAVSTAGGVERATMRAGEFLESASSRREKLGLSATNAEWLAELTALEAQIRESLPQAVPAAA